MRILGIDPGSKIMGWGCIDVHKGQECLGPYGAIRAKGTDISSRLGQIHRQLSDIIQSHKPNIMVLESVFVNINPHSALTLGYARGVALTLAALYGLDTAEYAATEIKKNLTGHGHATKDQMIAMIARILGPTDLIADTADALAGALCHARHLPFLKVQSLHAQK